MVAEKVGLKISSTAAAFMKKDAAIEDKMKGARGEVEVSAPELATILVYLMHDSQPAVRETARSSLENMPDTWLESVVTAPETHPKILHFLAQINRLKPEILTLIQLHPHVEPQTLQFVKGCGVNPVETSDVMPSPVSPSMASEGEGDEPPPGEQEEEFQSKYQLAQVIGISDKIKFAMTGDKEWRNIMLKDSNKLVSGAVLKNPRITEQEILSIAKSALVNEEVVRIICTNKEWVKNYQIRKALVENNKTPLPTALRFMPTLTEKDLIMLGKSKNVSTVIASQARKAVQVMQKRR